MVKIYYPINDTWMIPNETIQGLKCGFPTDISKQTLIFPNVYSSFRLRCYQQIKPRFCLYFYFTEATAEIYVSIKNGKAKICFKRNFYCSETFDLSSDLFNLENANEDGNFEIGIKVMLYIERNDYPAIQKMNAMNKELWNDKEKDFDIIVIDEDKTEEKIQIHKHVFTAQSPAFEGMLRSGMEETKTNTLKMIDFKFKTVQLAVDFFYGQEIFDSINYEDIFELYRFADKYIIGNLMDCITTFISCRLMPSNITEISNIANTSTSVKFQQMCDVFIQICNDNETIVETQDKKQAEVKVFKKSFFQTLIHNLF